MAAANSAISAAARVAPGLLLSSDMTPGFGFDRRYQPAPDLDLEDPDREPTRRYARAPAPGKRPRVARVYRAVSPDVAVDPDHTG